MGYNPFKSRYQSVERICVELSRLHDGRYEIVVDGGKPVGLEYFDGISFDVGLRALFEDKVRAHDGRAFFWFDWVKPSK